MEKMCIKMSHTWTQTLRSQCELTSSFWVLPVTDCCPDPLPYFTSWLLWKRWMYKLGHYVLKARVSSNLINHGISCLFPTCAAWFCGSDSSASRRFHMSPATPSIQCPVRNKFPLVFTCWVFAATELVRRRNERPAKIWASAIAEISLVREDRQFAWAL